MNVYELLQSLGLEAVADHVDGFEDIMNREVVINYQPSYPLEATPVNVCLDHTNDRFIIACNGTGSYGHEYSWNNQEYGTPSDEDLDLVSPTGVDDWLRTTLDNKAAVMVTGILENHGCGSIAAYEELPVEVRTEVTRIIRSSN